MFLAIFVLKRSTVYGISTSHLVGYDLICYRINLSCRNSEVFRFIALGFIIDCGMGITL